MHNFILYITVLKKYDFLCYNKSIKLYFKEFNMNIKEELKLLVDEKYKEFHSNLCPGINNILGIRVPVLREFAKKLNKEYSIEDLLSRIDDEYYEEIMLKGMIIGLNKNLEWEKIERYIEEFVPKIDNWAICDTFCAGLKITNKYKEKCGI